MGAERLNPCFLPVRLTNPSRSNSPHYLSKRVECRPVWKPMHRQPVYADAVAYVNGVSEEIFKVGFCLPAGPCVTDDDVRYIVDCIKEAIIQ